VALQLLSTTLLLFKNVFVIESFVQEIRSTNADSSSNETSSLFVSESLNHS